MTGGSCHDFAVDPLEPLVVPAQHFAAQRAQRPVGMRRTGEQHFLRRRNFAEIGLRAGKVGLVGVAVPAGAGISRQRDFRKFRLRLGNGFLIVVGIDQHVEIARHVLAALDQHVVQMRIHADIGIGDGLAPFLLFSGGNSPGAPRVVWIEEKWSMR